MNSCKDKLQEMNNDMQEEIQNMIHTMEKRIPIRNLKQLPKQSSHNNKLPRLEQMNKNVNTKLSVNKKSINSEKSKKHVPSKFESSEPLSLISDDSLDDEDLAAKIAQDAMRTVERRAEKSEGRKDLNYTEILPDVADKLSSESQIHLLKTKVHIINEERDKLEKLYEEKIAEYQSLSAKVKSLLEDVKCKDTQLSVQNNQLNRMKKANDELSFKLQTTSHDLEESRKELQQDKQTLKQKSCHLTSVENKLEKSMEEVKYLRKVDQDAQKTIRDLTDTYKQKISHLEKKNQKLEKEKTLLVTGLKKQAKLIEILKKQKLHLEASKILDFCESDFIKLMELEKL